METICKYCKKTFIPKKSKKRVFCSWECYRNYVNENGKNSLIHKKRDTKVKVQCIECGRIEYVAPSRAKKYKCCSVECLGKYHSKLYNKKVELICPICGEKYQCKQSKINHHKTCGNLKCRKAWLSATRKGKNNSNYVTKEKLLKEQGIANQNGDGHRFYKNKK